MHKNRLGGIEFHIVQSNKQTYKQTNKQINKFFNTHNRKAYKQIEAKISDMHTQRIIQTYQHTNILIHSKQKYKKLTSIPA
jgi:hypothetical protein